MSKYTLEEFNQLGYEFAIRHPRVIELLNNSTLTNDIVQELLEYGINATSVDINTQREQVINSTQELYLNYKHLNGINHTPFSPYGEGVYYDENHLDFIDEYVGNKLLVHPKNKIAFYNKESIESALTRIHSLIESRGGKLERLISGKAFKHYDAVKFFGATVYSLDPTKSTTKTITSDIEFIHDWIINKKYLHLIPQYSHKIN